MSEQPRYTPLAASGFFADGMSARPLVEGTVARGGLRLDERYYEGKAGTQPVAEFPLAVTRELLERGRVRFNIFCTPCHGSLGNGDGIVVQRGFRAPPSYHIDRLRTAPVGHFFDVVTNGFGAMASYASRVPVRDRWAIIAYIRALQLSQQATLPDVPAAERPKLQEAKP
jgi:mono/diheme cytochrome c family protein